MANEYEKLLDADAQAQPAPGRAPAVVPDSMQVDRGRGPAVVEDADFANMLAEERDVQRQKIQSSMYAGTKADPDQYAKVLELSKKTKLPPDTVARKYDEISKEIRVKTDYDELIDRSPGLAKWLEKPDNAAVGQDDLDNLKKTESAMQQRTFGGELLDAAKYGFYRLASGIAKAPALASQDDAKLFEEMGLEFAPKYLAKRPKDALLKNELTQWLDSEAQRLAPKDLDANLIQEAQSGNYKKAGRAFALQVTSNIPQLAMIALTRGKGLALMGASVAGEKFASNIEQGIPEETARWNALLSAGIETGIESLGGIGANPLKQSIKNASARIGSQTTFEVLKQASKEILKVSGEEGLEEAATTLANGLLDYGMDVNPKALDNIWEDMANAFVVGAGTGGIVGAAGVTPRAMLKQFEETNKAESSKEAYLEVGSAAKESRVKGRSAEVHAGFIDSIAADQNMRDVYIPVEVVDKYFQSANENVTKVMQDLGATEAYAQAKETGGDVRVPFSTFVDKLSQTKHYEALQDDIKFDPADRTVNELKAERETARAQVEERAKEAVPAEVDQMAESGKAVVKNVAEQLKAIKADPKQAAIYRGFEAIGRRAGIDPLELFNRYQLKVERKQFSLDQDKKLLVQEHLSQAEISEEHLAALDKEQTELLWQAYQKAAELKTYFDGINSTIAESVGGKFIEAKLKGSKRAVEKIKFDYSGDATKIKDILRGTIEVTTIQDALAALDQLKQNFEVLDKGFRNLLDETKESFDGYRDIKMNVKIGDIVAEIQINIPEMIEAKNKAHKLYEERSKIARNAEGKSESARKLAASKIAKLDSQMKAIYDSAFADAIKASKSDGETRVPLRYAESLENLRGGSVSQAAQKNLTLGTLPIVTGVPSTSKSATLSGNLSGVMSGSSTGIISSEELASKPDSSDKPLKQGERGQILIDRATGAIRIELLKDADPSTFLHETGHLYMKVLSDLSKELAAIDPAQRTEDQANVIKDVDTILKWMGADSVDSLTIEQQEQFARGFEAYLMEGKAPSNALRKVFSRFKVWLVSVYRTMRGLNVELTDDVRRVMDRMLATDEEISEVYREQNIEPLFKNAEEAGMTKDQFAAYNKAREEARLAAEEALTSRVMGEFERERKTWFKETKARLKAEALEQVKQMPVYRAIDKLSGGLPMPDGKPLKLSRAALKADFSKELVKRLPSGILDSRFGIEGIHPAMAAEILGFQNADDMVTQIANAPKPEVLAEQMATEQMADKYPELVNQGPLFIEEAVKVAHNEKRSQVLRMELEHMASNNMPALKTAIKRIAARVPSDKAVKEQAKITIGKMKIGDIKPHLYLRAEAKAAKEAGEFLAKGDFQKAFESKRKELLSHELYRASVEAKEEFEKYVARFKPIMRADAELAKNRDMDLINAARAILAQYGIGKTDKPAAAYLEQMRRYDPETYSVMESLVESATQGAGHYKEIAFNDFAAMGDSVIAMWDLAKSSMEIEIDGKAVSRAEAIDELSKQIGTFQDDTTKSGYEKTAGTWDKVKVGLLGAKAALTRAEAWANAMDVGKPDGPFTRFIWNPVSDGTLKYRTEKSKVIKQFKQILEEWGKSQSRAAIPAPELKFTFKDKTELMMAILHTGNGSNLDKLLRGRGWANPTLDGSLDTAAWDSFIARMQRDGTLTKADYDFAQKIWDLNESLKPGAQVAHKKMYGHYFSEITAAEFKTPFGDYRGGYIPAKVDIYTNEDASIRRERELFEKNNNSFQFPTTGRGFTKSRVQQYAQPLSLDMNLLGGHIDGVLRFTHIEPRVKQVARIVQHTGFRQRLADVDPTVGKELLTPWLQRAATQRVVIPAENGIGKLMDGITRFFRRSVAMQIMFGNVTNTMQQFTGAIVAASKIEPKYIRSAMADYVRDVKGTNAAIMEKSEWMRANQDNSVYEAQQAIERIIVDPSAFDNAKDFATKHTYVLQTFTQNIVNTVVWTAAYNKSVEAGLDEKTSVRQADAAVRLTQGSSAPEDISRFETGTATARLFTQFAGYFNMLFNLGQTEIQKISREVGLRNGAGRLFYVYMTAFMIPAVLSEAVVRVMAGTLDEDDDEEYLDDMLTGFFGSQFRTATAMIPYGGQFLNAGLNRFNDKPFDDRVSLSPVVATLESMVGVPSEVYKAITGEMTNRRKVTKDALMFIGVASSLPVGPLGKPAGYLIDVAEGRARPSGPIDFTRGLVTGRAGQ